MFCKLSAAIVRERLLFKIYFLSHYFCSYNSRAAVRSYGTMHSHNSNSPNSGNSCISEQVMNDKFVLLLNKPYLNSGKPRNSGQFTADQTFHYCDSTLRKYY